MVAFKSAWLDWRPESSEKRTDETDRTPFVSTVSATSNDAEPRRTDGVSDIPGSSALTETSTKRTAKADKNPEWDSDEWQGLYGEEAGINEYYRGLARDHAERMAFEQCIAHWLALNKPIAGESGSCLQCGQPAGRDALPTTCAGSVPGVIHTECHLAWGQQRREQAVSALAKFRVKNDRRA